MAIRQDDRPQDEPRDPALDRAYAAGRREEPPPALDTAILAAARREANSRPRPIGSTLYRWRAPLAFAAVLVVSVTVVLLMREEGAERISESHVPMASPPPPPATEKERASEDGRSLAQPAQDAPRARPERARPDPDTARLRDAPTASAQEERRKAEAYPGQNKLQGAPEAPRPASRPFPEATTSSEPKQSAPESPPLPSDALAKRTQQGASTGQALERAQREQPAPRPSSPRAATEAPQAPAIPDSAAGPGGAQPRGIQQAAPERAPGARQEMREDVAGPSRPVWRDYEAQPPEKWLERVAELHRSGRAREANEMLAEFRKRFPQHRVPAALER